MFNILVTVIDVFVAWRWGDWRNWTKYQATILYTIVFDLLYNFLTYNHSLWKYEPTTLFPNHTTMSLLVMFVAYPSVLLVYLGRYPFGWIKQILWIGFWVFLWSALEFVSLSLGQFSYYNGWNFMWSVLFDITFFSMARLHYKKPLLCFALSVVAPVILLWLFKVPISNMK
ncbi:CBO0543 family protein [Neobacillus ginsengisoli]|uniref:Glucan phosphoethanolaminetransferase (Alkaline phosphatase superfamily) n=1 Tax=Neobacillus ginsengisoli TaxID=904295 RepID=A0ABT9Y415_9BACI|nr:CBO0543 family protein [Neobacillus ginsengisoli]MDQ0201884.1 glucan phosphoethanolaminetransferase (alkaline phosphatase superfamily) [Neobacillus ginsengisoli]